MPTVAAGIANAVPAATTARDHHAGRDRRPARAHHQYVM
jgi:hypothetical protein